MANYRSLVLLSRNRVWLDIFDAFATAGFGKQWLAFLQNHREVIVCFDFFTVATVTFQLLYCFS